jgi:hypothetical protein
MRIAMVDNLFPTMAASILGVPGTASALLSTPTTQVEWYRAGVIGAVDTIQRTVASPTSVRTLCLPTAVVASQLNAWHDNLQADINALKVVTKFQRKYINYQATYNAFLLGTLTEDEFDVESDAYVSEEKKVDPLNLAPIVERLKRLLEFPLTDRELGEYLEVDYESIVAAIKVVDAFDSLKLSAGAENLLTDLRQG